MILVLSMSEEEDMEEIRRRKLKKLKEQAQNQEQDDREERSQEESIDQELRKFLTQDAWERLNTAELANPEVVKKVKKELVQAHQMGKISGELDEEKIREILSEANDQTSQSFDIRR